MTEKPLEHEPIPVGRTPANDFAEQATAPTPGLLTELWDFLRDNKKWWLGPIILTLLLVGALLLAGGSAAPFIYTLF